MEISVSLTNGVLHHCIHKFALSERLSTRRRLLLARDGNRLFKARNLVSRFLLTLGDSETLLDSEVLALSDARIKRIERSFPGRVFLDFSSSIREKVNVEDLTQLLKLLLPDDITGEELYELNQILTIQGVSLQISRNVTGLER